MVFAAWFLAARRQEQITAAVERLLRDAGPQKLIANLGEVTRAAAPSPVTGSGSGPLQSRGGAQGATGGRGTALAVRRGGPLRDVPRVPCSHSRAATPVQPLSSARGIFLPSRPRGAGPAAPR